MGLWEAIPGGMKTAAVNVNRYAPRTIEREETCSVWAWLCSAFLCEAIAVPHAPLPGNVRMNGG